jgi:periplasmic mercuric ion binding protein
MKIITAILTMFLITVTAWSQDSKLGEIKIKTSSQCEMCKERIEEALAFEKGIKDSDVDVEKQTVKVNYKKSKTSPEKIRKAISKAGYDADDVKADPKAYGKLPACCKKPDDPDHKGH